MNYDPSLYSEIFANYNLNIIGDGERRRRYILCYNPKEAERQRRHREEIVLMLEEELSRHPENTASDQWAMPWPGATIPDQAASQKHPHKR